jgi:hypothetical protein
MTMCAADITSTLCLHPSRNLPTTTQMVRAPSAVEGMKAEAAGVGPEKKVPRNDRAPID